MGISTILIRDTYQVSENCELEIKLTSDTELDTGTRVEIQLPNSWSLVNGPSFTRQFQATDPDGAHFVEFKSEDGNVFFEISITACNQIYEKGASRHGRNIAGILKSGKLKAGEAIIFRYRNTFAPYITDKSELKVKINGISPEKKLKLITLPGPCAFTRIIVPSGAKPDEEFPILIVSLDSFDNCSSSSLEKKTLYCNDGGIVAENLNFTGSMIVPFRISKEGVFRFKMDNTVSNAIRISKSDKAPCWGDLHIHTKLSHDGQGEDPYPYARDVSGLDFAASAEHWQSLGEPGYEIIKIWAENSYEPGKFVTIPADERNPVQWNGHHNIYFRDMEYFMQNKVHPFDSSFVPEESWPEFDEKRAMIIPHHTGISFGGLPKNGSGEAVDLSKCEERHLIPAMEIYSHHGQSEVYNPQHILSYEFNRMRNPERRANTSFPGPYYAQNYWMAGEKIGVIASSDEHSGQGGRRHGGIAAVYVEKLTRESVFDAIRARHSYGTTGERILLDFRINGTAIGETLKIPRKQEVKISLKVWGTATLLRVDILRFRFGIDTAFVPVLSDAPRPETMDIGYKLTETVSDNCVYYARITQEPLEWPGMAWTSPIWVETEQ
ncbi:MAG: hypothetical protein A2017_06210 [Lentisphaerae bacterium GWF2_44_16]|nr:MAG: hypothetical protein A2017_06210 [Lentisphaerae bacterium GWF2_44_16]